MENLFSTSLQVNNQSMSFHVVLDKDKYVFIPQAGADILPEFCLIREKDIWKEEGEVNAEIKNQAVDRLEQYLLKQH